MSNEFRRLIAEAASRANDQITEVHRRNYRPKIDVVVQGERPTPTSPSAPRPARAVAA